MNTQPADRLRIPLCPFVSGLQTVMTQSNVTMKPDVSTVWSVQPCLGAHADKSADPILSPTCMFWNRSTKMCRFVEVSQVIMEVSEDIQYIRDTLDEIDARLDTDGEPSDPVPVPADGTVSGAK